MSGEIEAAIKEFNEFKDIKSFGIPKKLENFQFQKNGVNAALDSYVSASNQIQTDVQTDEYKEIYASLTSGKAAGTYEKFKQERTKKNEGSFEYGDVDDYLRYTRTSLMQSHIIEKEQDEKGQRNKLYRLQGKGALDF